MKRVLIGMAVTWLWASAAQAQTCYGALGTPLTVGADVGFSANTQAVTAGVAKDSGNMYLRGAVAIASVSGTGTAKGFVGLVGYNLKVSHSTRFSVCPTVTVLKLWGIEPGDGSSVSPLALSFGGSVGFNATTFNTTQVVPTFGLFVNRLTEHFGGTDLFGTPTPVQSSSEWYGELRLGVGFIFHDKISVVPALLLPIGFEEGEVQFSVVVAYKVH